jgi:hypothetical protein
MRKTSRTMSTRRRRRLYNWALQEKKPRAMSPGKRDVMFLRVDISLPKRGGVGLVLTRAVSPSPWDWDSEESMVPQSAAC